MRSVVINIIILFAFGQIFAAGCDEKKKAYESKLDAWKEIETKMKSDEITKAKYDEMLPQYNALWTEAEKLKAEYLKCQDESENKHKASYNEGIALKKDRKYKEALGKFVEAIKQEPDFQEAYEQAADVCAELGNYAEMEKYLEKVKDGDERGKTYHKVGGDLLHKDPDKAIEYYLKMSKYYKADNAYYLIGGIYLTKKNDPENAIVYYKKALQIDPKDHKTYNALGGSLEQLSSVSKSKEEKDRLIGEAVSVMLKGVQLGPKGYSKYYELCARLSQLYNVQGKAVSALQYADQAIQYSKDAKYSLGHLERGIALNKMKRYGEAKASLLIAQEDLMTKSAAEFYLSEIEKAEK